jgi:hypothetical protein
MYQQAIPRSQTLWVGTSSTTVEDGNLQTEAILPAHLNTKPKSNKYLH